MKPIVKLLFVALLIGVTLSLPSKVRASSGEYVCTSEFPECYSGAEQALSQCANRCTEDGGGGQQTQVCWAQPSIVGYSDGTYIVNIDTICDPVNYSGANCVQQCVNVFLATYEPCMSEYCTSE